MSRVEYPADEDLHLWVEALSKTGLAKYLPIIDDVWYEQMVSCLQVTALHPVGKTDACGAGAMLFHKITKNHYRIDGNKRSAVICTYLFFVVNRLDLDLLPDELYELARRVADSEESPEKIIGEIRAHFTKVCKRVAL